MSEGPFGIPGPPGESGIKMQLMPSTMRALRAIANGGSSDVNLLAARAADEIERQEAEIERLKETIRALGRGDIVPITDRDAENERLRAALKPFAEAAWDDLPDEADAVPAGQKRNTYTITVGDVRRARAAIGYEQQPSKSEG